MKFGEKLTKLRKENALSQEELAEKLNVTRQTISKWELDQTVPDTENMKKIAEVFGTTVGDLLDENTDPIKENEKSYNMNGERKGSSLIILLLVAIVILSAIGIVGIIANRIIGMKLVSSITKGFFGQDGINANVISGVFDQFNDASKQIQNETDNGFKEYEVSRFNQAFDVRFSGTKKPFFMSSFIDEVINSNSTNPDHQILVSYGEIETSDANELRNMKSLFETKNGDVYEVSYDISYERDSDGYITKAIVLQNKTVSEMKVSTFNGQFTALYYGSKDGFFMANFLDTILKSNETNPEHIVAVNYNGKETSDPEEIRAMKKSFKNGKTYDIHYEYDESGLINKAIIEK